MRVDKTKWTTKQISSFFDLQMGRTPSRKSLELWENGDTPWVSIADMSGTRFISSTKEKLSAATIKQCNIPIIPVGTVIMSFKLTIGKTCIANVPLTTNEAIMAFYPKKDVQIDNSFLCYALSALKWKGNRAVKGVTINKKTISQKVISLPDFTEQQAIASELDAVQAIIDGYKAQIADLDALAQSIFLDMFGDPITNQKEWEINSFSKLFTLKSGDGLSAKQFVVGDFPVYGGNGIVGFHNLCNKSGEYIIVGRVGAKCGNVRLVKGKFWLTDNAFELTQKHTPFNNVFLVALLSLLNLGSKAKAMAQPVISNASLKDVQVILPPFALQQHFAGQVEAIEKQKELIRQQLADAETLMKERMQYYFS